MLVLKGGRLTSPLSETLPSLDPHPPRVQCRMCLVIFDWLDQMPRGMRAGKRTLRCEAKTCAQPFYVRSKIVEGHSFLIPFILGPLCPKFSALSSQAPKSSSSGKPLGNKKSS